MSVALLEETAFLFTDPHYNHRKLVEKGFRPEGYEEEITKSWRAKVGKDDTVYCLGDVCMGKEGESHERYVRPMPGRKILVTGNHDKQKSAWYLAHGWDEVHDSLRLVTSVNGRHTRLLLTHIPVADDGTWDLNVHGHFHNDAHRAKEPAMLAIYTSRHRLLALECVNYQLVSFKDFLEGRIEQPGLPTLSL